MESGHWHMKITGNKPVPNKFLEGVLANKSQKSSSSPFDQFLRQFSSTKPALADARYKPYVLLRRLCSPIPTSNFATENVNNKELFNRKGQGTAEDTGQRNVI